MSWATASASPEKGQTADDEPVEDAQDDHQSAPTTTITITDRTITGAITDGDRSFCIVCAAIVLAGCAGGGRWPVNPVHAALSPGGEPCSVWPFCSSTLEAHFLAAVQIIVYAGAIVVLFLFVIMLLGVDQLERPVAPNQSPSQRAR